MDLELKIENFGPIDKATIQVGRFTVFAGPNNTGKTFVAKMLYSILNAMNANHARVFFATTTNAIESTLQFFGQSGRAGEERPIGKEFQKIDSILQEAFPSHSIQNELDLLKEIQSELIAEIEGIKVHFQALKSNVKTKEEGGSASLSDAYDSIESTIGVLEESFRNIELAIIMGWQLKFLQNVHGNFQSSDVSYLKGDGDSPLCFSVQGVGELREMEKFSVQGVGELREMEKFRFTPDPQIVQNMQSFHETFYLESPLYWKLKSALESIKLDSSSPFGTSLNGIPDYFYDMAVALRRRRIGHPFARIHKSLHDEIGGHISLSEAGDLEFQQYGKSIPLSLTSAGVANMGMLALLIERGALDRGSFLFIDEPESNLHPAWQAEMAEFLFELVRQGVNVVVSTHSMTILKWLEVHVKEKPEDRELVKLNKFPPDAEWNDDMDAVMAEVKQSLTKPFSDLYIKGL